MDPDKQSDTFIMDQSNNDTMAILLGLRGKTPVERKKENLKRWIKEGRTGGVGLPVPMMNRTPKNNCTPWIQNEEKVFLERISKRCMMAASALGSHIIVYDVMD